MLNLDCQEKGFDKISIEEIQSIMKKHGIITFPKQVNPLFGRFDKDKDGLIGL